MKFYEAVFQFKLDLHDFGVIQMSWFPMEQGSTGASGTLIKGTSYVPSHQGTLVYFSVADIPATLDRAAQNGGKILAPKKSIGEHGFVDVFEDSEGNRVAVHAMS